MVASLPPIHYCMDGGPRMRLPNTVHTSRPWRIHELTRDFRLEDVWALPTPGGPDDFPRLVQRMVAGDPSQGSSRAARTLFAIRWKVGRGAARLGRPGRRPRLGAADAARPVAGGSARRPIWPGLRGAPLHLALPARRRVGRGDRQPDSSRREAHRLGPRRDRRLPRPDGRLRQATRTAGNAYMAAIKPFRYRIVYPALMRQIGREWRAGTGDRTPAHA